MGHLAGIRPVDRLTLVNVQDRGREARVAHADLDAAPGREACAAAAASGACRRCAGWKQQSGGNDRGDQSGYALLHGWPPLRCSVMYTALEGGRFQAYPRPACRSASQTVFERSMAIVMGPTPPGTGGMAEATWRTVS